MLISLRENFSSRSFSINKFLFMFTISTIEVFFFLTYDNTFLHTQGRKKKLTSEFIMYFRV